MAPADAEGVVNPCLPMSAVLEGLRAAQVARKAFAAAAEEAEILVDGSTKHNNPGAKFLRKTRRRSPLDSTKLQSQGSDLALAQLQVFTHHLAVLGR